MRIDKDRTRVLLASKRIELQEAQKRLAEEINTAYLCGYPEVALDYMWETSDLVYDLSVEVWCLEQRLIAD